MIGSKIDLSTLVQMLETKQEDVIYLARNGIAVAQVTLITDNPKPKRIGIAEGKFKVPENFDSLGKEIGEIFGVGE